jgi:hypothetical protein
MSRKAPVPSGKNNRRSFYPPDRISGIPNRRSDSSSCQTAHSQLFPGGFPRDPPPRLINCFIHKIMEPLSHIKTVPAKEDCFCSVSHCERFLRSNLLTPYRSIQSKQISLLHPAMWNAVIKTLWTRNFLWLFREIRVQNHGTLKSLLI